MKSSSSRRLAWLGACISLGLLAACDKQAVDSPGATTSSPATPPASTADTPVTDKWLGQWNGPEGTFLRLTGGNGRYEITLRDLDGPQVFEGSAKGDEIRFERKGMPETIRASDGEGTGMKWLAEKEDCLVVRKGEGFCRD